MIQTFIPHTGALQTETLAGMLELPFDVIKFDRSMVLASGTDERSEKIVENVAHMFKDMAYDVLYEDVEDAMDEERCKDMPWWHL